MKDRDSIKNPRKFKFIYIFTVLLQVMAYPFVRILFGIFTGFEIQGRENLKNIKNTGVIFAANHSSEWDPVLVTAALPWISRFMPLFYTSLPPSFYSNSGVKKYMYGGLFFKFWGAYPVYLGKKDYEQALVHHIEILSRKRSLCIFPEGGITKTGEIREAKAGVAFLAHRNNVPVVPMRISGVYKLTLIDFILRRKKVIIRFGKPLFPKDIFGENNTTGFEKYKKGSEVIMNEIKKLV